jgi:hypothetical protein
MVQNTFWAYIIQKCKSILTWDILVFLLHGFSTWWEGSFSIFRTENTHPAYCGLIKPVLRHKICFFSPALGVGLREAPSAVNGTVVATGTAQDRVDGGKVYADGRQVQLEF